jgi:hypothetical protein
MKKEETMAENEHYYCMCITEKQLSPDEQKTLSSTRAAVLKSAKWQRGETITVRFLEGDPGLQERVRAVAREWTAPGMAPVNLDFRNSGPTDIRIAFRQGNGSWSYLGRACRSIPEPNPTMNFGWLTPASPDNVLRPVVLHEFGHALGLIHEHQNPEGGIRWNKAAVINDLSGPPNNWDDATIENNMFKAYEKKDVIATQVDPTSIMMYPIPKAWTLDGFSAGFTASCPRRTAS